jgi:hypothetical protein
LIDQSTLWIIAGLFAAIAALAFIAEHRRAKRRDLDKVGWVPWNLIQIFAIIAAAAATAFALKA